MAFRILHIFYDLRKLFDPSDFSNAILEIKAAICNFVEGNESV